MQKKIISLAVAGIMLSPFAHAEDAAPAPASPLTFNVGVVSDYLFRGVSQTHGKPALQGGVDYAFESGAYVGAWASTITWVKDGYGKGSTEIDVYGGYKNTFVPNGDWNYDVGYITYNYPGHGGELPGLNTGANPNTQEVYGAIGWKWLSAKYSYVTSGHFIGWNAGPDAAGNYTGKTSGSNYLDLSANYDLGDGWTLIAHVGHQKVKGYSSNPNGNQDADYTDWKFGASKDIGFGVISAYYSDTNTKGTCSSTGGTNAYCWANGNFAGSTGLNTGGSTTGFRDVSKGTVVVSYLKTF